MTTPTKIVLGIASVGSIGGGVGYGMHALSKDEVVKKSLKIKLTAEGFDTNVTEEEWTAIETAHKSSVNKFNIPAGVRDNKEWLKNHCKDLLEKEDEANYSKAIQWCVKKEKIVAILKKENSEFRTLNVGDNIEESEKRLWKDKIEQLKLPANSQAKATLKVTFSQPAVADDSHIKEIQGKCKLVIETETIGEEFENKLTLSKEWCSVAKEG